MWMRILLGLYSPMEGEVIIESPGGEGQIGYLPQVNAVSKDFPASVREIVLSGCQGKKGFHPFYTKDDKIKALSNMERMGISDLKNRCFRELSGGQKQRVLLARALCAGKKALFLDEPVSGLDTKATAQMYGMIGRLNEEGMTVLMVSHDIKGVLSFATHILKLGENMFFGTLEEYLESESGRMFLEKKE